MKNQIRDGIFAGFGAVVLTREKIEAVCRRLVDESKLSKEDARGLVEELSEAGRKQLTEGENLVRATIKNVYENLDIASNNELRRIKKKLCHFRRNP